jgi:hypothetical protein
MISSVPAALFGPESFTAESDLFYVTPGWFAVLSAFGFLPVPVPVDPDRPRVIQRACLYQVQVKAVPDPAPEDLPCGVFLPAPGVRIEVADEGPVVTGGCPWELSACDTARILDLPGIYRLVLNDPAAAGTVRIYMTFYTLDLQSRNPALHFGG